MSAVILRGDAAHLPMADASVDSVVCDPPYGLAELPTAMVLKAIAAWMAGDRTHVPDGRGFMGREWDKFVPPPGVWDECLRVLKPGGHLLAFAGPRTVDLMTLSIRIAGFEIRDSISWVFGQGFPKSHDVSKAIDRMAGAEREITATGTPLKRMIPGATQNRTGQWAKDDGREFVPAQTAPATEDAARWDGWGTALKPAHEPIVVARKPLAGKTVAANVLEHGTGALNIDGCRVSVTDPDYARNASGDRGHDENRTRAMDFAMTAGKAHDAGRWPGNILLSHSPGCEMTGMRRVRPAAHGPSRGTTPRAASDVYGTISDDAPGSHADADGMETVEAWDCADGCPVAELDRQSGVSTSQGGRMRRTALGVMNDDGWQPTGQETLHFGDTGGASRFFPVFRYQAKAPASERPRLEDGTAWPTVKPVELMRWLARLVTPPGGTVLDPFCGTGTTGEAAILEGFDAVLIDKDPDALALTRVRLAKPVQPGLFGLEAS